MRGVALCLLLPVLVYACGLLPSVDSRNVTQLAKDLLLFPGFKIEVVANVTGARSLSVSESGTMYVGTLSNKIYAVVGLQEHNVSTMLPTQVQIYTVEVPSTEAANGVTCIGADVYVATTTTVYRFPGLDHSLTNPPAAEVFYLLPTIPTTPPVNPLRYIRSSPTGDYLYISIAAPCNAPNVSEPSPAWRCFSNELFGTIIRVNVSSRQLDQVVARGVRYSLGMDFHPVTGELWFTDTGRTGWSNTNPPDELNKLVSSAIGSNFGFPYCYGKGTADPVYNPSGDCSNFTGADLVIPAHSNALGFRFYNHTQAPPQYQGQGIMAQHGSEERQPPAGYTLGMAVVNNPQTPTDAYQLFAKGWLTLNPQTCTRDSDCLGDATCQTAQSNPDADLTPPFYCSGWGTPVDIETLSDGSLIISDDLNGVLYSVVWEGSSVNITGFWIGIGIAGGVCLCLIIIAIVRSCTCMECLSMTSRFCSQKCCCCFVRCCCPKQDRTQPYKTVEFND